MTSNGLDPLAAVRAAFLDTFEEHNTTDGRCIHFLMPGWYGKQVAARAAHLIGPYGTFEPDIVLDKLDDIIDADPSAQFCFGREGSVVLYVKCEYPEPVVQVLETSHPQELDVLDPSDPTGQMVDRDEYEDSHEHCFHEGGPPTPAGHLPAQPHGYDYVRAWWDND